MIIKKKCFLIDEKKAKKKKKGKVIIYCGTLWLISIFTCITTFIVLNLSEDMLDL